MGSRRLSNIALAFLFVSHSVVLFPGFFSPYSFDEQNRYLPLAPPTRIHLRDQHQRWHLRPFVYRQVLAPGSFNEYSEDRTVAYPVQFFVAGPPYQLWGLLAARRHLLGASGQGRIFLLGTDAYGRDELSRLIYGGRISLFAGLLATILSVGFGLALGGLAGYYGRWVDDLIMRSSEVFLSVPWLYLLLTVRALLPLHMDASQIFLLLTVMLGAIGWARPARLVRAVVLSARQREFVLAAKGFGASDLYALRKHVLPFTSSVVTAQLALYVPQYILAEVTLSFFGLGLSEPGPSWGNMLAGLQNYFVLRSCPWMFAPAVALFAVFLAYRSLFSRLRLDRM